MTELLNWMCPYFEDTYLSWLNHSREPIVRVPGVIRIVGFGKIPACIDDSEIAAVRLISDSEVASMPWKFLRAGERVRLTSGALCGLQGIFVKASTGNYIVINITLMQRQWPQKSMPVK